MPSPAIVAAQINAIKDRHEHWWRDDNALAEAAALWGGGCNDCGVFNGEEVFVAKHGGTEASVLVAETNSGLFAFGVRFRSFDHGFSHAPSVWGEPFASREDALRAGVQELLSGLGEGRSSSKRAAEDARRIRQQLEAKLGPRQRLLFE